MLQAESQPTTDSDDPLHRMEDGGHRHQLEHQIAEQWQLSLPNTGVNAAAAGAGLPAKCVQQAAYLYEGSTGVLDQVALNGSMLSAAFTTAYTRKTFDYTNYEGVSTSGSDFFLYEGSTGEIIRFSGDLEYRLSVGIARLANGSPILNQTDLVFEPPYFYLYNATDGKVIRLNANGLYDSDLGIATNADGSPLTGYEGFDFEQGSYYAYDAQTARVVRMGADLKVNNSNFATLKNANGNLATGRRGLAAAGLFYLYNPADAALVGYQFDGDFLTNRGRVFRYVQDALLLNQSGIATSDDTIDLYNAANGTLWRISRVNGLSPSIGIAQISLTWPNGNLMTAFEGLAFDGTYYYLYDAQTALMRQVDRFGKYVTDYSTLRWANGSAALNLSDIANDGVYFYGYEKGSGAVHQFDLSGNYLQLFATFPAGRESLAFDDQPCRTLRPNLAVGRQVEQSSTAFTGLATRAIDSNYNGSFWRNSSTSLTNVENQPWWQVDLNGSYLLDEVTLWNRQDCCIGNLSRFYVFVSNNDMRNRTLSDLINDPQVWKQAETGSPGIRYQTTPNTVGRYVRVQMMDANKQLALAEVEVYGTNLALNKSATQSSSLASGAASGAVDGLPATASATTAGTTPWWQVNLGQQTRIGRIDFFNLPLIRQYHVFVSNSDMSGRTLQSLLNDSSVWHRLETIWNGDRRVTFGPATGQYVRIQMDQVDSYSLALSEVLIYGAPASQAATDNKSPDPARFGEWADPIPWPINMINANLNPDGSLLTWDASPDSWDGNPDTNLSNSVRADLWDYRTNQHSAVTPAPDTDLFCASHVHLEDGKLFTSGGDVDNNLQLDHSTLFDYLSTSWTRKADMSYARWYPSSAILNNGEVMVAGGIPTTIEVYNPQSDLYRTLTNISFFGDYFPWIQQAPNGKVFYAGPRNKTYAIDSSGNGSMTQLAVRDAFMRSYGNFNLYDVGKVLVTGGETAGSSAMVLDMNSGVATATGNMAFERTQAQGVVLPDGTVLTMGGHSGGTLICNMVENVFVAELWSPTTGTWKMLDAHQHPRQYHSTALLLPDGRVWLGGDTCSGEQNVEIFSPPYLFNANGTLASRPVIDLAPVSVAYDTLFQVQSAQATTIQQAALIRLSAVTHSTNFEQRRIPLTLTTSAGQLTLRSPQNSNIAPPGYYMLFLINQNGVPSVAKMIQITGNGPLPPTCGGLLQEAEAGTLTGSFVVGNDAAASGGSYVHVPTGAGDQWNGPNNSHKADYCFTVTQAGTYQIQANVYGADDLSDSFYVKVDNAPATGYLWDTLRNTSYATDFVSDRSKADPVEVQLAAGQHNVSVFLREDGTRLDKLELKLASGPPPPPTCGGLLQEAEAGVLTGSFAVGNDAAASGGQYIHVPSGAGDQWNGPNNSHKADYCFNVTQAGTYRIQANVYAADDLSDSFYVKVNDAPTTGYLWDTLRNTTYAADFVSNRNVADPVEVQLSAGNQNVTVYLREDGTRLDKLELIPVTQGRNDSTSELQMVGQGVQGQIRFVGAKADRDIDFTQFRLALVDGETAGERFRQVVTADANGAYHFDNMEVGSYFVQLEAPAGFVCADCSKPVAINTSALVEQSFEILLLPAQEGEAQRLYLPLINR